MKEKGDKKHKSAESDLDFPDSDLYDNLEFAVSEDEEEDFYSFRGDDYNDLDRDKLE
jgi:hypothetical protein